MLDYSDEYLHWDNTEPVTVVVRRAAAERGTATIDVALARRGTPHRHAQFYNGVRLQGNEITWDVPVALLDGVDLKPESTITDQQGVAWTVVTAVELRLGSSRGAWQCLCRESRAQ